MKKLTTYKNKIKGVYAKTKSKLQGAAIAFMTTASTAVPVSAATVAINENTDIGVLIGSIVEFICKIAFYVGIVVLITGVFMLIMAYKDDNSEQQTRGVRIAVVGAALVCFRILLRTAGLIS